MKRCLRTLLGSMALSAVLYGCSIQSAWRGLIPGPAPTGTVELPGEPASTAQPESSSGVLPLGPGGGGAFDVFAFNPTYIFVGTDLGGIFRSADRGQTWETANRGLYDYMINDIAVDPAKPNTMYAATPGGVYKSDDSGNKWMLLQNGFPPKEKAEYSAEIGTVAVDPLNPQVLYAGGAHIRQEELATGNGVLYKSTDAGASWLQLNVGDPAAAFYKIVVDPLNNRNVYAAASSGFFKSADGGESWTKIDNVQSRGLVAGIDKQRSRLILYRAAWTAGVYRSDDDGLTWQKLRTLRCPHNCEFYRIVLDPSDPQAGTVYAGDYGDWNLDQGIFATSDGGQSWKQINMIDDGGWIGMEQITRVRSLGLNPYHAGELYYGNSMGLFRTQDEAHWQQIYTAGVAAAGGESLAWPGQWHGRGSIDNTQANTRPMFNPANPAEYYIGYADIYLWKTADNGASWQNLQLPGDNDIRALAADPKDTGFRTWFASSSAQECCSGALYKTTDGGRNWRRATGLPNDRILDIAVPDHDSDLAYAATLDHGLYASTNGGISFSAQNGITGSRLPNGSVYQIAVDPQKAETLYVSVNGRRGGIFQTQDGGETWHETGAFTDCYAIQISPINSQVLFAGCGLELYRSTDGGANWQMLFDARAHPLDPGTRSNSGYIKDIAPHPVDANTLCFVIKDDPYHDQASGGGLHCTLDGGTTWKEIASPLGLLLRGTAVAFHPLPDPATGGHDLFYMTGGDGAYRIPFDVLMKVMKEAPAE